MPVVDGKALAPPKDEVFVVGRLPTAMKKKKITIRSMLHTYYRLVKILAVQVLVLDKKSVFLVVLF